MDETPDVNQKKVEALKEAVNQGIYQVPHEELARKMLGNIDIKG
jgi:flagellar biosynthesis anti-sigma factor FlgM